MMINDLTVKQCPGVELLSAFCDCADPEKDLQMAVIGRHVDSCRTCQQILAAYRQVDRLVFSACQPPVDFAEHVLAAVSDSSVSSSRISASVASSAAWYLPWQRLLQVAAAVIFLTLAAAILLRPGKSNLNSDPVLAELSPVEGEPHIRIVAEDSVLQDSEYTAGAELVDKDKIDEHQSGRRVQADEVKTVSVERNVGRQAAPTAQSFLPAQVRHVWSVKDFQQSREVLDKWAAAGNLSLAWEQVEGQQGQLKGKVVMEDARLQEVVDKLHAGGWKLLTAALPQPDNGEKIRFTGQKVAYDLVLVRTE